MLLENLASASALSSKMNFSNFQRPQPSIDDELEELRRETARVKERVSEFLDSLMEFQIAVAKFRNETTRSLISTGGKRAGGAFPKGLDIEDISTNKWELSHLGTYLGDIERSWKALMYDLKKEE